MAEKEVGKVTHYFRKIGVAVVELTDELKLGDTVHIKGGTADFEQKVESMEIEHEPVEKAVAGQSIGLKVAQKVRGKETVYKVIE
ncbi:MAG: hypothetical protein U9R11_00465 [Chloroflexota bacterium]|nr:hypothetical protein [Chloroflexota bacterium]